MWWVRVILLVLLLLQHASSNALTIEQEHTCPPSSCGKLSKISYPFRLRNDPSHCGDSRYELSCENNVTTLYLYSAKYHVQYINYNNFTIRVVDPGVQQDNCSSLPRYFLSSSDFFDTYKDNEKDLYHANSKEERDPGTGEDYLFKHIVYLNCSHQVTNNPKYVDTTTCVNWNSKGHYIYAMAGDLIAEDFQVGCHVKLVTPTSWFWGLKRNEVVSYDAMHKALVYGFEISWLHLICGQRCGASALCTFNSTEEFECSKPRCLSFMGLSMNDNCGKYSSFQLILILDYEFCIFSP
jgi:hypothetical protein